ncbi:hypothetical protein [Pseudomonas sp. W2I6]|uniref:hypothetical protein n=1 Tax=Pseudomonas sp. W2I6 TaxID=3042289 RepID=UPI002780C3ED|nr:hypothetical protein [Pseudomonas sp. W2I6]MDQ0668371.1 hypothetical protein [Pseudomonas sp. W2I6]
MAAQPAGLAGMTTEHIRWNIGCASTSSAQARINSTRKPPSTVKEDTLMFDKKHYLVSFILDNQPQSRTLEHAHDTLLPDEAQALLKQQFPELKEAALSDVQVQKRTRHDDNSGAPGHYQQP